MFLQRRYIDNQEKTSVGGFILVGGRKRKYPLAHLKKGVSIQLKNSFSVLAGKRADAPLYIRRLSASLQEVDISRVVLDFIRSMRFWSSLNRVVRHSVPLLGVLNGLVDHESLPVQVVKHHLRRALQHNLAVTTQQHRTPPEGKSYAEGGD